MGWSIAVLSNTVEISEECAEKLWALDRTEYCQKCEKNFVPVGDTDKERYSFYCYDEKHRKKYLSYTSGSLWDSIEYITEDGKLSFNSDHMEHMDYLADSAEIVQVLTEHKVEGDICFGSLDGDNAGSFWGYRFDGKGGMKPLEGTIEWYVDRSQESGN